MKAREKQLLEEMADRGYRKSANGSGGRSQPDFQAYSRGRVHRGNTFALLFNKIYHFNVLVLNEDFINM